MKKIAMIGCIIIVVALALCGLGTIILGKVGESLNRPQAAPFTRARVVEIDPYVTSEKLKLGVMEYRVTDSKMQLGQERKPAEGAKFISFRIYVENIGETASTFPSLFDTKIMYKGENIGGYTSCDIEWKEYGECIWKRIYPGTSCEGWKCHEIPKNIDPSEITLWLNISTDRQSHEWRTWRLE